MDARRTAATSPAEFEVPKVFEFSSGVTKTGTFVEGFEAPKLVNFGATRQSQVEAASPSIEKRAALRNNRRRGVNSKINDSAKSKKEKETENDDDVVCATALLDLSFNRENEVQGASALLKISSQNS
ncbi:hypothetical protein ABFS82_14G086000 [Erythranthe guttata]